MRQMKCNMDGFNSNLINLLIMLKMSPELNSRVDESRVNSNTFLYCCFVIQITKSKHICFTFQYSNFVAIYLTM